MDVSRIQFIAVLRPKEIVEKMNGEVRKILSLPDVKERLATQGIEPVTSTPETLAELIKSDLARWAQVIKAAGI